MATYSGAFSGRPFRLDWILNLEYQLITENRSAISRVLRIVKTGSQNSFRADPSSFSATAASTRSGTFTYDFRNYNALQLFADVIEVEHGPDGTLTLAVSASVDGGNPIGTADASGSFVLPRIPRAALDRWNGAARVPQMFERGAAHTLQVLERWDGSAWKRQGAA